MKIRHVTLAAAAEIRKDPRSNTPTVRVVDEPDVEPGDPMRPLPEPSNPHAAENRKRP